MGHFRSCCFKLTRQQQRPFKLVGQVTSETAVMSETPDSVANFSAFQVTKDKMSLPRVCAKVAGYSVDMGVDAQSSVNCISGKTFETWTNKPKLKAEDSVTFSYDGKTPMRSRGRFEAVVE
jgi:hypothetical protein